MIKKLMCLLVAATLCAPAFAQSSPSLSSSGTGPRKQLATIIFAGLAGAVLGLSTLSFYGRPQDHLSNIATGFAVGVISGTIYTTYLAATRPMAPLDDSVLLELYQDQKLKERVPSLFTYRFQY